MFTRLQRSLTTWPTLAGWQESAVICVVATAIIAAIAATTGLLTWQPRFDRFSLLVFVVPAFTEELMFRAPLPARGETARPALWLTAGVVVFTLWHVVEAMTFLPGARLFLEPRFLTCAAVLGAACALMRYRTGSLWPAVLFHGLIVMAWHVLFGGPTAAELMLP